MKESCPAQTNFIVRIRDGYTVTGEVTCSRDVAVGVKCGFNGTQRTRTGTNDVLLRDSLLAEFDEILSECPFRSPPEEPPQGILDLR